MPLNTAITTTQHEQVLDDALVAARRYTTSGVQFSAAENIIVSRNSVLVDATSYVLTLQSGAPNEVQITWYANTGFETGDVITIEADPTVRLDADFTQKYTPSELNIVLYRILETLKAQADPLSAQITTLQEADRAYHTRILNNERTGNANLTKNIEQDARLDAIVAELEGIETGITGHNFDPETSILTLRFSDGNDTQIDFSVLGTAAIAELETRLTAAETSITALGGRLSAAEQRNTTQDGSITSIEAKDAEQDTAIEAQNTRLTAAETTIAARTARLDAVEAKDREQDLRLTANEAKNVEQDNRLTAVETRNTAQDGVDAAHNTRITATETKNTAQDTAIAAINARLDGIQTGIASQNYDPATATLTLTFSDGSEAEISFEGLGQAAIEGLRRRIDAIEALQPAQTEKDTEQDNRLTGVERSDDLQNTRLDVLETGGGSVELGEFGVELREATAKNVEQDNRLTAVEAKNAMQDTKDTQQDGQIQAAVNKNTQQDSRITATESTDAVQNARLDAVETKNTQQDASLTSQGGRIDAAEGILGNTSWLPYFNYYAVLSGATLADALQTNIPNAAVPNLTGGATFQDGVFDFNPDSRTISQAELPAVVRQSMIDASFFIMGTRVMLTTINNFNYVFYTQKSTGLSTGMYIRRLSSDPLPNVYRGSRVQFSNTVVAANEWHGFSWAVDRDASGDQTSEDGGSIAAHNSGSDSDYSVRASFGGGNSAGTDMDGHQSHTVILLPNAAYNALSAEDKTTRRSEALKWASLNSATKELPTTLDEKLVELGARIDGVATGISGHSYNTTTHTLTLNFNDGTSQDIDLSPLSEPRIESIISRLTAAENAITALSTRVDATETKNTAQDTEIAANKKQSKAISGFLYAHWDSLEGSPLVAGNAFPSTPIAIGNPIWDAVESRLSIGNTFQGISWENTDADFTRFGLAAYYQIGNRGGWNTTFFWGVDGAFATTGTSFQWGAGNNSGFGITLQALTTTTNPAIVFFAYNGGGHPYDPAVRAGTGFIAERTITNSGIKGFHNIKVAVANGKVYVVKDERHVIAVFTIPDNLPAGARGAVGNRFGLVHDGDLSNRDVHLFRLSAKPPTVVLPQRVRDRLYRLDEITLGDVNLNGTDWYDIPMKPGVRYQDFDEIGFHFRPGSQSDLEWGQSRFYIHRGLLEDASTVFPANLGGTVESRGGVGRPAIQVGRIDASRIRIRQSPDTNDEFRPLALQYVYGLYRETELSVV